MATFAVTSTLLLTAHTML